MRFFEGQVATHSFRGARLTAQDLYLNGGDGTGSVTSQPALANFHELLRPSVILVLRYAFPTAQCRDAFFATQPIEPDANLVLD